MKGQHSKIPGGLAGLERQYEPRGENRAILSSEMDPQLELEEASSREQGITNLRLLWENRRFLGRVTAFALFFSIAIALIIPNRYQSSARLMPPDNQSGSGLAAAAMAFAGGSGGAGLGGLGGLGGLAGQFLGQKSSSDLIVGVLQSRTVADTLIQKFNLRRVYWDRRMEDARKDLANRTETSVDRKSQIITITVTDKDPHRAMGMAQTYVEELNRLLAEGSTSSARRERIFLESRLRGVSMDLEAAEKEFSRFASKNSTLDIKEQGKAMLEAGATLQGQLIAARSELEGLRQIYADSNVRVRSMEARIAELEAQLRKVGGQDEGDSPTPLSNTTDSLYPSIRRLPLIGVTYEDLYRKTKVQETVFEMLTQEYESAKVQEAKEIPTVKVLDLPNLPDKKSFPPRTLIVVLTTALTLAMAGTWLIGRARWETADPGDPGKMLAQEVIDSVKAALPWISRNGHQNGQKNGMRSPMS